jgi:hypothetical protein
MIVLLHTLTPAFMDGYFTSLNDLHKETPIDTMLILDAGTPVTDVFVEWAGNVGIPVEDQIIRWDKYGYDAFQRTVLSVLKKYAVDLIIVPAIDSSSLELVHIAKLKNIKVMSLNGKAN